jgi:hypothetical protein
MFHLRDATRALAPAEWALDCLATDLAHRVTDMPSRPYVDSTGALRCVLSDVGCDIKRAQLAHKLLYVVGLVCSQCHMLRARYIPHQVERRKTLAISVGVGYLSADDEAVPVLNDHVAQVGQSRFVVVALAIEPSIRISRGLVRLVAALLAMEVRARSLVGIAAVLAPETLLARPRFEQCSIHAEVLV